MRKYLREKPGHSSGKVAKINMCRVHFSRETKICSGLGFTKPINGLTESISQVSIPFLLPGLLSCLLLIDVSWNWETLLLLGGRKKLWRIVKVARRPASDCLSKGYSKEMTPIFYEDFGA